MQSIIYILDDGFGQVRGYDDYRGLGLRGVECAENRVLWETYCRPVCSGAGHSSNY